MDLRIPTDPRQPEADPDALYQEFLFCLAEYPYATLKLAESKPHVAALLARAKAEGVAIPSGEAE
jgi:hypothetical protein